MNYEVSLVFYILTAISVLIFLFGMWGLIHMWKLGKNKGPAISPGKWVASLIKTILIQPQVKEYDGLAWVMHLMIFYGFMLLLFLTGWEAFLADIVPSTASLHQYFKVGEGNLILSVWGEIGGLLLLLGILLAIYRRYVLKPEKYNTISDDSIAIWLLFLLVITGFICQVVRLAVDPAAMDLSTSFTVAWLVPAVKNLNLTMGNLRVLFYIHSLLGFAFVAYIPFSKFKHIFATPMVYSNTTASESYSKP